MMVSDEEVIMTALGGDPDCSRFESNPPGGVNALGEDKGGKALREQWQTLQKS